MVEERREVHGFPGYFVSMYGSVFGGYSGRELTRSYNQGGHPTVGMDRDGRQYRRSVAPLVALAYLDPPEYDTSFGTDKIIQLDGDRANCQADNLLWRPNWFARKYHQERRVEPYPNWKKEFELVQTGEIFAHPRDCAIRYGLLEKDIQVSIMNQERTTFPYGFSFRFIH